MLKSGEAEWCGSEGKGFGCVCLGLINSLTLGKIPDLSRPQFPDMFNGYNSCT